jgi:hypothetical protein
MRAFPALFLVAVLLVACNDTAAPTPSNPAASASAVAPATEPATSEEPPASEEPSSPTETASPPVDEPSSSASTEPGAAAACSGSDKNRDFFRAAASALSWTVYCAVLPAGWFVDTGQYRQAGGGWVEIAYRGPGGARLELHEGAFCAEGDGCVPPGTELGDAPFGDRTGTLVALDDGGFALVVDRGEKISWLAIGTGLDEATFRMIAAALAPVGG